MAIGVPKRRGVRMFPRGILIALAGLAVAAALARCVVAARRRRRSYFAAMQAWLSAPAERRHEVLRRLTCEQDPHAAAWFLLGCALLRQSRAREAARAFGMAHHADFRLQNAALLTFASLKATEGPDSDIIEQIVQTWHEMRRPGLMQTREDRRLLDCLAATTRDPPRLSPLGRLIWFVVGPVQQSRLELMLDAKVPLAQDLRDAAPETA